MLNPTPITSKVLLFCLLFCSASADFADEKQTSSVDLYFFWSHRCPHCLEAKPAVEALAQSYPWLVLHSYDLVDNPSFVRRYMDMAAQLGMNANAVPGFIFCGQMMVGFAADGRTLQQLQQALIDCHRHRTVAEYNLTLPLLGNIHDQKFSLPVITVVIAALDAFNPCAFFVLFFLLSLIAHQRNRARIVAIGGTFVIFSGLMYFLFMAAWLNLFLLTEQLAYITAVAGLIAIVIGAINIKDFFWFKQGVSLSIPDSAKPKLLQRIRVLTQAGHWPVMLFASVILAVTANSYELLCTAGLPMIFTRVLTLNELDAEQYYFYLVFYNIVYIIPLMLIVIIFTITLGNKKLSEQEGRLLKLLSGCMMLGLGGMLFFSPESLNNMSASMAVIGSALGFTLLFAVFERFRR